METWKVGAYSVWVGTPETPAPCGDVEESAPTITVVAAGPQGVRVRVRYRRIGRSWQIFDLRRGRGANGRQSFSGKFPRFDAGESIEYEVELVTRAGKERVGEPLRFRRVSGSLRALPPPAEESFDKAGPASSFVEKRSGAAAQPAPADARVLRHSVRPGADPAAGNEVNLGARSLEPGAQGREVPLLQHGLRALGSSGGLSDHRTARTIRAARALGSRDHYVVQGTVVGTDGYGLARAQVVLHEKRLRSEPVLSRTLTDEGGQFRFEYPSPRKPPFSIIVRAGTADGSEIAESEVICDAGPEENVTIVAGDAALQGPSEFAQLERAVGRSVALEGVRLEDLSDSDLDLVACWEDLDRTLLAVFAAAGRLSGQTGIAHWAWYGLLRQGLTGRLGALLLESDSRLGARLATATADGRIPPAPAEVLGAFFERVRSLRASQAFSAPDPEGAASLSELLTTGRISRAEQEVLVARFVDHKGETASFWESLRDGGEISASSVERAQLTVQLGALTKNHVPLVRQLMDRHTPASTRELVRLERRDWLDLIRGPRGAGTPSGIPGADLEEREETYAAAIEATLELAFPTPFLAARLKEAQSDAFPGQADVVRFLERHPDFDLGSERVDTYSQRDGSGVLDGILDRERLELNLRGIQRISSIAGPVRKHEVIQPLLREGLSSAIAVERMGASFVHRFSGLLGEQRARQVYGEARQKAAIAVTLFASFNPGMHSALPRAVLPASFTWPALLPSAPSIPNWAALFGNADLCACRHCASMYGPAAYLVDLLAFVAGLGSLETLTAATRRPDLVRILLNCENAKTPLPCIDLVNEILSEAVAPSELPTPQTAATAAELRAQPQHRNLAAEAALAVAAYPWSLPFARPVEEARGYLDRLGMPRDRLMELFRPVAAGQLETAAERLRLTPLERVLVTGSAESPYSLPELWGRPGDTADQLRTYLVRPRRVMAQAGLSLEDLSMLLATRFVSPGAVVEIAFEAGGCDLDTALIEPQPSAQRLDRMHRFERLRRKLGWSFYDLDRAIASVGGGAIDDGFLAALASVQRLREQLDTPLEEMLAWWAPVDAHDYDTQGHGVSPSLYRRVFQNPVVLDEDGLAALALAGVDLAKAGEALDQHLPALAGVLGASVNSLRNLAGAGAVLSLATLSSLYRAVSLARALGLADQDLAVLIELCEHDPFSHPAAAVRFVDTVSSVRKAGFSAGSLDYLLRLRTRPGETRARGDAELVQTIGGLRAALRDVHAQHVVAPDPDGSVTEAALGRILQGGELQQALGLIRSGALEPPGDLDLALKTLLPFLEPDIARDVLVGSEQAAATLSPASERPERFAFVLSALVPYLHEVLGRLAVQQRLTADFDLPAPMIAALLGGRLPSLMTDPVQDSTVEISPDTLPEAFSTLRGMARAADAVATLDLNVEEVACLTSNAAAMRVLNLGALPAQEPPQSAWSGLFEEFCRLATLVALHRRISQAGRGLLGMLSNVLRTDGNENNTARLSTFLDDLHQATGWNRASLDFLAGEEGLDLQFPDDYVRGEGVHRLAACMEALDVLGLSSANVVPILVAEDVDAEGARVVRSAAKSKYDTAQWLQIAKTINDPLRERYRDALVGQLIATRSAFRSAEDLFGHFLVDTQVSPCRLTSRIREATSSVQTFVQRILLHLEPDIELTADQAAEWRWRRQYRVWEANRKVFLYPENWIEPELRDDKTPQFRDFETALASQDLTSLTLEEAVAGYVRGLAEVGRPEISAIYHDRNTYTLHLFARTREMPEVYMHRRLEKGGRWTAWERIPLDIEGDHLVPAMMGRHLYLFWPVFLEKTEPPRLEGDHADQSYELRLAFSLWQGCQWSERRLSKAVLEVPHLKETIRFYFRAVQRFGEQQSDGGWTGFGGGGTAPIDWSAVVPRKIAVRVLVGPGYTVELGRFQMAGDGSLTAEKIVNSWFFDEPGPEGALVRGMAFVETNDRPLVLPTSSVDELGNAVTSTLTHIPTLERTPGRYRVVYPHQFEGFATQAPFVYQDDRATFLVRPIQLNGSLVGGGGGGSGTLGFSAGIRHTHSITPDAVGTVLPSVIVAALPAVAPNAIGVPLSGVESDAGNPFISPGSAPKKRFAFETHYHPRAAEFLAAIHEGGVDALLGALDLQTEGSADFFGKRYDPVDGAVRAPHPREGTDFSRGSAYGTYNWELFFHVPLLVAERLRRDQRFEEAQEWYHLIFDPTQCTVGAAPRCYWKVRPFFDYDLSDPESGPVRQLIAALSEGDSGLSRQVAIWRQNPFDPHEIALLRPVAYQKAVVMKYLENLIAWADSLFRRDSFESVAEATQLYILASEILGPRPEEIETGEHPAARTFEGIAESLDAFSNALVEIEERLGPNSFVSAGSFSVGGSSSPAPPPTDTTLLFCVPPNEKLLGFWDTVEDRLFKIRHCMNIEGSVRDLPLFAPPIDPGLLVRAKAAGVDLATALGDLRAPAPHYRFRFLLERALEFVGAARALGASLLDALEQRDGEALARLRAGHEVEFLRMIREVKERQIEEAQAQLDALRRTRESVTERQTYYETLPSRIPEEEEQLSSRQVAGRAQGQALDHDLVAADTARFLPDFALGWAGTGPYASASLGRANVIAFLQFRAQEKHADSARAITESDLASIRGAWVRRQTDWGFQADQAKSELRQIEKQIVAAEIRLEIAQKDLATHLRQSSQADEVARFFVEKYTDEELHEWRASQLSSLYFQAYQISHDLARSAERAFQNELGLGSSAFVEFGNWDNLRKGLVAGERLELQLRRLESAYLDRNRREYELTKHVSLSQLSPLAVLRLKEEGRCEFAIPEALFDLDHPGHYFRRIKAVSLSIPAVVGPFGSLACTLRLLRSTVRRESTLLSGRYGRAEDDDPRFLDSFGAIQSIATSTGSQDNGLFELNFRDERLLPFEGQGVISSWELEMANEFRQADYDSISDVVLSMHYTSRDGGSGWKKEVESELLESLNAVVSEPGSPGLWESVSARRDFPSEWDVFLRGSSDGVQSMTLEASQERFPYVFRDREIRIDRAHVVVQVSEGMEPDGSGTTLILTYPGGVPTPVDLDGAARVGNALLVAIDTGGAGVGSWVLEVGSVGAGLGDGSTRLSAMGIRDVLLVLHYGLGE